MTSDSFFSIETENLVRVETEFKQFPDGVHRADIVQCVETVVVLLAADGVEQPHFFVIADGIDADVEQPGEISDPEQLLILCHESPLRLSDRPVPGNSGRGADDVYDAGSPPPDRREICGPAGCDVRAGNAAAGAMARAVTEHPAAGQSVS